MVRLPIAGFFEFADFAPDDVSLQHAEVGDKQNPIEVVDLVAEGAAKKSFAVLGSDITSPLPFSTPQTPAGALYYRFVSAVNLSTADLNYSNRGFKAANIFLNGQIPMKARLTTYQ